MTVPPAFRVNLWGNLYVMGLPLPTCLFTCQFPKHWSCKNHHRDLFVAVKTVNHRLEPTQLVAFGTVLACQSSQVESQLFTLVLNTYSKYTISPICNWTQWIHRLPIVNKHTICNNSSVLLRLRCSAPLSFNYNNRLRGKKRPHSESRQFTCARVESVQGRPTCWLYNECIPVSVWLELFWLDWRTLKFCAWQ